MDELVAVGTAGLLGLILVILGLVAGLAWVALTAWCAWANADGRTVLFLGAALFLIAALYTGCGLWLQKTGRI